MGTEPDGKQPASRPWLDPTASAFVEMQGIRKTFGNFVAVDKVDLRIYRGELFCLLGGSGCGKTTLLRMLAGFETPSSGRILIDGQDMAGVPPYERPVNMMFQSYALFPHMNVETNIAYGLKHEPISAAQRKERVREMLDLVQLTEFGKRKPHQLSGGQRQRVALARALAKQPKLLLLDEPLAALDKKLREQTQFELMNIQDQVGVTFIVVTHDQEEAMALSTRIAVMDRGNIVQVGTPSDIYEFPNSRFTADFIGKINVFEGAVTSANGSGATIDCAVAHGDLEVSGEAGIAQGTPVWVAVRPEKIEISRDAPAAGSANTLRGTVKDLAYFGDYSIYRVRLANDQIVHVSQQNTRRLSEEDRQVDWDDEVWLTWQRDAALVLTE